MTTGHDEGLEREARVDRMFSEFQAAQSRREAKRGHAADSRRLATARGAIHIPAEYLPLYTYLTRRCDDTVVLTFEEVEALLEFALPTQARTESGWWAEAILSHSSAWTETGRSAMPSLPAQTVTFARLPMVPARALRHPSIGPVG
jgi:hypothetical protein